MYIYMRTGMILIIHEESLDQPEQVNEGATSEQALTEIFTESHLTLTFQQHYLPNILSLFYIRHLLLLRSKFAEGRPLLQPPLFYGSRDLLRHMFDVTSRVQSPEPWNVRQREASIRVSLTASQTR